MKNQFKGIIAYPITPFDGDGQVNLDALKRSIDRLIADGVDAIAPLGSTGESAYLSHDEWNAVAECAIKHVDDRVPVVVGISDLTTRTAVSRAKFAEAMGADAVMVLPITYWKLSEDEIFTHYAAIAAAIGIPIMLYNNPATSGIDMQPEFIVRMVREIDNITMVKESSGDIQRMHRIFKSSDGQIPFYNGSNPLALEAFAAGAVGWCTAAPNLIPQLNKELYEATADNDVRRAREVFYKQLPLLEFILKGGLPTTIKAGLRIKGFDVGEPRRPLKPLSAAGIETLSGLL